MLWGVPIFLTSVRPRNRIPAIKLLAISKTAKLEFFRIVRINLGSLRVYRGALRVPNFYVASLCARNPIPTIKLLAISKTGN